MSSDEPYNPRSVPKKNFSKKEDEILIELVNKYGQHWNTIAGLMERRTARQCKERYEMYLDPNINKDPFTLEEDKLLLTLVQKHGTCWTRILKYFDKRTSSQIKNRWQVLERLKERKKRIEETGSPLKNKKIKFNLIPDEINNQAEEIFIPDLCQPIWEYEFQIMKDEYGLNFDFLI